MNVVAIGGPPGAGKSEVMRHALDLLRERGFEREPTTVTVNVGGRNVSVTAVELSRTQADGRRVTVVVLGRYDEGDTFPGTDRLSMSVQPAAEHVVELLSLHAARSGDLVHVLFEGDRLFSKSFLLHCAATQGVIVRACVLAVTPEQLDARRTGRGSTQNASWVKGRTSKVAGVVHWLRESGEHVTELRNDPGLARECAEHVVELLDLEPPEPWEVCERCNDTGCSECRPS